MKRAAVVMLLATVGVWAALFMTPEAEPRKPAAQSKAKDPLGEEPFEPVPVPEPPSAAPAPATPPAVAQAPEQPARIAMAGPALREAEQSLPQPLVNAIERTIGTAPPPAQFDSPDVEAELAKHRHSSPEHVALETQYAREPREGPWALATEAVLRGMLDRGGLADRVTMLHCRSRVCRLQIDTSSDSPIDDLLKLDELRQATAITTKTPYVQDENELTIYLQPWQGSAAPPTEPP